MNEKIANTTRKRGFLDAKKDVSNKNVENKCIPDATHTTSEEVSVIPFFSTPKARLGQLTSGIGQIKLKIHLFSDAMQSASEMTSGIRGFPDTP